MSMVLLATTLLLLLIGWRMTHPTCRRRFRRRAMRMAMPPALSAHSMTEGSKTGRRKPEWVCKEVLRLKARLGNVGVRTVAATFNRLHGAQARVGKTFVSDLLRTHHYDITCLRRELRSRPTRHYRVNALWALDFSFQTDADGSTHGMLGIIDQGSRCLLALRRVARRNAWIVLGHVCLAIGEFGKPRALRMDNEAVFKSRLLKRALRRFGIRRQYIRPHSPWQNGRIERLFGTLKPLLKKLALADAWALDRELFEFRLFYNHVRPHQNLNGRTPQEVWHAGSDCSPLSPCRERPKLVSALGGLLVGYYLRR